MIGLTGACLKKSHTISDVQSWNEILKAYKIFNAQMLKWTNQAQGVISWRSAYNYITESPVPDETQMFF